MRSSWPSFASVGPVWNMADPVSKTNPTQISAEEIDGISSRSNGFSLERRGLIGTVVAQDMRDQNFGVRGAHQVVKFFPVCQIGGQWQV